MLFVHKIKWPYSLYLLSCMIATSTIQTGTLSSLAKNDAFPIFTTKDPHTFLQTGEKLSYKNVEWVEAIKDRVSFSVSAFGQNADRGKSIRGEGTFDEDTNENIVTPLGDLTGRSNMIALLFGEIPEEFNNTDTFKDKFPNLDCARKKIFKDEKETVITPKLGTIDDGNFIDPNQENGNFSFPLKYRKRGVRFELAVKIYGDVGLNIQTGIATIRQILEERKNLTTIGQTPFGKIIREDNDEEAYVKIKDEDIDRFLMKELDNIADEIGLDISNFVETSVEEVRFNLFWRHVFELNTDTKEFPHFLLIPFFEFTGSLSPGKKKDPNQLFALPFGNNSHHAVGFTAGVNFDFTETIEFGGEVGWTHFFCKKF